MYKIEGNLSFFEELEKEDIFSGEICSISHLPLEEDHVRLKCGHKFNSYYIFNELYNKRFERFKFIQPKLLRYQVKCPYCRNIQEELIPYQEKKGISKIYGINDTYCENYKEIWRCQYIKKTKQMCHSNCTMPFKETGVYYCENHYNITQKKHMKDKEEVVKCSFKDKKKCPNKLFKEELCKKHYYLKIKTI